MGGHNSPQKLRGNCNTFSEFEQAKPQTDDNMDNIQEAINYYKANRIEFIGKYHDKHLVIMNSEIVGVFNTNIEAVNSARQNLEPGTYIIEHPLSLKIQKASTKK